MAETRIGDCGHDTIQDYEWPGNDGRTICYGCFEIEVDESWWEMVDAPAAFGTVRECECGRRGRYCPVHVIPRAASGEDG